jgi:hypothetical protein
LFTAAHTDFPQIPEKVSLKSPRNRFQGWYRVCLFLSGMIWKDDYMNSLGGLPREVQEEIMEMPDTNYSSRSANKKGLVSRVLQPMRHLIEKLNLLFKKNQGAKHNTKSRQLTCDRRSRDSLVYEFPVSDPDPDDQPVIDADTRSAL